MRVPGRQAQGAAVLSALLFPTLIAAASMLDCSHVRVKQQSFDLRELGGPHSVMTSVSQPPSLLNTTYTIDICRQLRRSAQVDKDHRCPNGARVCAIERTIVPQDDTDTVSRVITIAGDVQDYGGGSLDAKWELLSNSNANSDIDKEGLRLEMNGGMYPLKGKDQRPQKAIVEFICDPNRTGLEGNFEGEDKYLDGDDESSARRLRRRVEGELEDAADGSKSSNNTASLRFIKYGPMHEGSDTDVLRLEWRTKYACEGKRDEDRQSSGWGFFTWFIIIVFLGISSYLIFGSWLNYNRYGARGWDMLPHGDTIRDLPYLMKDWTRKVVSTVQTGGARGGYSAV